MEQKLTVKKYGIVSEETKRQIYESSREKVRVCDTCLQNKSIVEFTTYLSRGKGLVRRTCKNCVYLKNKKRRKEDPAYRSRLLINILKHKLKKKYGLPLSWYEGTLKKQKNRCAVCKSTDKGFKGRITFCIDHCHDTGKVRGLLCDRCNKVLGLVEDNSKLLQRMKKYLKIHGK